MLEERQRIAQHDPPSYPLHHVRDVSSHNFGLLIAYLLPGFVMLFGWSFVSDIIATWLLSPPYAQPTLGGVLYVTLASLGLGLTISAIRWAVIDPIHHRTGIPLPPRDFVTLADKLEAYQYLVVTHYDYYKFFANSSLALLFSFMVVALSPTVIPFWIWIVGIVIEVIFWLAQRDTLAKYCRQGCLLLGENGE